MVALRPRVARKKSRIFIGHGSVAVGKEKAARAIALVSDMERLPDCRELMHCLVR
jgi:hypothetical protein